MPDILIPFCLPSVHNQDYWQKTRAPYAEQQSCPHFYWYQIANGSQFQPRGVEADRIFLQEPSNSRKFYTLLLERERDWHNEKLNNYLIVPKLCWLFNAYNMLQNETPIFKDHTFLCPIANNHSLTLSLKFQLPRIKVVRKK